MFSTDYSMCLRIFAVSPSNLFFGSTTPAVAMKSLKKSYNNTLPGTCSKCSVSSCLHIEKISQRVLSSANEINCRVNDHSLNSSTSYGCHNEVCKWFKRLCNVLHLNKIGSDETADTKWTYPKCMQKVKYVASKDTFSNQIALKNALFDQSYNISF